ncbi:MAG: hypothetical protein WD208_07685 [Dehalococcoidia bacterium]
MGLITRLLLWHGVLIAATAVVISCTVDDATDLTECERAFEAAAEVPDHQDTVEDLHPAVRTCVSVEDWTAASERFPDALDGVDPVVILRNLCLYGPSDAALCSLLE